MMMIDVVVVGSNRLHFGPRLESPFVSGLRAAGAELPLLGDLFRLSGSGQLDFAVDEAIGGCGSGFLLRLHDAGFGVNFEQLLHPEELFADSALDGPSADLVWVAAWGQLVLVVTMLLAQTLHLVHGVARNRSRLDAAVTGNQTRKFSYIFLKLVKRQRPNARL